MAQPPDTEGKNLVEMLDMLKPIPEPEPISMIPATQGWIWLSLAVLAALVWLGWRAARHWQANAYRRAALKELDAAGDDPAKVADILRRAALVAYPRRKVVGLLGPDWLAFLSETCPGAGFSGDAGEILLRAPWRDEPPDPRVTGLARHWLKAHRREAPA
ncbi:DUF4381 domain-containing protein [Fluviibacterium sp. DFM31]|uniref:DUF4381 domain-containing protein n=1 Tax=Meridianimarinicoccus marinus TaxID=3231483 RepID=A0ABV3L284_9RHOB